MRGLLLGLLLGLAVAIFAYENGILIVGEPGHIDTQALKRAVHMDDAAKV